MTPRRFLALLMALLGAVPATLAAGTAQGGSKKARCALFVLLLGTITLAGAGQGAGAPPPATQCAPPAAYPAATTSVAFWSTEARCAIVPAGPGGVFGRENFGNKFPGDAAVYMGIVHAAIYDAAVAIEGGYRPYGAASSFVPAETLRARTGWFAWAAWRQGQADWKPYGAVNPGVRPRIPRAIDRSWWPRLARFLASSQAGPSPEAAIATAAYDTLTGLQPQLGASQAILDGDYAAYLAAIPDGTAKTSGITVGRQVAQTVLALRVDDGRGCTTTLTDLGLPAPGPGVWQPAPGPAPGLCLPGMRPLALESAAQLRPGGPNPLTSKDYADDVSQVEELGRIDSTSRTPVQTDEALFWTDHDIRQWNDGMLRLAAARGLDLVQTARMLAMAHIAGGDAMIACFDAKYHYWFWRPYQAIPLADTDGNPATVADPTWKPFGATPNFPEYPSAHACHSSALVEALDAFFGTDKVAVYPRQPRPGPEPDGAQPDLQPSPRRGQGRRLGACARRFPLPQLRPARLEPRPQGRPLRQRQALPAGRLMRPGEAVRRGPPPQPSVPV